MSNTHCAVQGCKMTVFNKPLGVYFYQCPTSNEMRNKWLHALKNKCTVLDWTKSRICSKHFEHKYFDSHRKLIDNAVPTLFPVTKYQKLDYSSKDKVDKFLHKQTQEELEADIKKSLQKVKDPANVEKMITDDLKCKSDAPEEVNQWLLIKKQNHLITRLMELIAQNKRQVEILQKDVEETKKNAYSLKYVVKCTQEKLVHLEEQIEILTAVESQ